MTGLEANHKLVCLYLQENIITTMEGLNNMVNLAVLNLADNCISSVEGLAGLNVDSLYLGRNRIGHEGVSDLVGLLEC